MTRHTPIQLSKADLARWQSRIADLLAQIECWSKQQGWAVAEQRLQIDEPGPGRYETRELHIKPPGGVLVVQPIARDVVDADGRVDMYALATLNRVMLLNVADQWIIRTDSGVDWPSPWGEKTFVELGRGLVDAR